MNKTFLFNEQLVRHYYVKARMSILVPEINANELVKWSFNWSV